AVNALASFLEDEEGNEEVVVAIPDLLRLVEQDRQAAWSVSRALERIGPSAVPYLLPHLGHNSEHVQECVLQGLKGVGVAAAPAPRALLVVRKSTASARRQLAVEIVGRIGPAAAAARDDLLRLLRDRSAATRQAAIEALGALGPAPGVLSAVSV